MNSRIVIEVNHHGDLDVRDFAQRLAVVAGILDEQVYGANYELPGEEDD